MVMVVLGIVWMVMVGDGYPAAALLPGEVGAVPGNSNCQLVLVVAMVVLVVIVVMVMVVAVMVIVGVTVTVVTDGGVDGDAATVADSSQ